MLACCKANYWSRKKKVKYVQLQSGNPRTGSNHNSQKSTHKWGQQLCKIWWIAQHWGHRYTGVKFNTFWAFNGIFFFFSLHFPFPNTETVRVASWLKGRGLVQGCAFWVFELSDYCREMVTPENYPSKAPDTEFTTKWTSSNNSQTSQ